VTDLPNDNLLLVGPSGCGKSHLARQICRADLARGLPVLVAAVKPDSWPCSYQSQSIDWLMQNAFRLESGTVLIDDAQTLVGKNAKEKLRLANCIRVDRPNFRRSVWTTQDPFDLDRQVKLNCATVFLWFTSDAYALREWERHCAIPGLAKMIQALDLYHFIKIEIGPRGGKVTHYKPAKKRN
jgi:GTPase SAR1 family protein